MNFISFECYPLNNLCGNQWAYSNSFPFLFSLKNCISILLNSINIVFYFYPHIYFSLSYTLSTLFIHHHFAILSPILTSLGETLLLGYSWWKAHESKFPRVLHVKTVFYSILYFMNFSHFIGTFNMRFKSSFISAKFYSLYFLKL